MSQPLATKEPYGCEMCIRDRSKAKDIMRKLFDYYYTHPDKLPEDFIPQLDFDGISRTICDYIAGMTDKYAIYKYSEIFIPTAWQVR